MYYIVLVGVDNAVEGLEWTAGTRKTCVTTRKNSAFDTIELYSV